MCLTGTAIGFSINALIRAATARNDWFTIATCIATIAAAGAAWATYAMAKSGEFSRTRVTSLMAPVAGLIVINYAAFWVLFGG